MRAVVAALWTVFSVLACPAHGEATVDDQQRSGISSPPPRVEFGGAIFRRGEGWAVIQASTKNICILLSGGGINTALVWYVRTNSINVLLSGGLFPHLNKTRFARVSLMFLKDDQKNGVWHDVITNEVQVYDDPGIIFAFQDEDFERHLGESEAYGIFDIEDRPLLVVNLETARDQTNAMRACARAFVS